MIIGLDLRGYSDDACYGSFVLHFSRALIAAHPETTFYVYSHTHLDLGENALCKKITWNKRNFFHNIQMKKFLSREKLAFAVFFDHHIPNGLDVEYYMFVENIKEIFFPTHGLIEKIMYQKKFIKALNAAKKICVFENNTAKQMNEKLNIHENTITIIPPAITLQSQEISEDISLPLDIKAKYNLKGDYFIYDGGNSSNSNFERLLEAIQKLIKRKHPVHLLVLCDSTSKDIELRQKVLEYNIENSILFLGNISEEEKPFYYKQSIGAFYPSIYESMSFDFHDALLFGTPIFANDLSSTKEIFGDSIHYAAFLSPLKVTERIETFLESGENRRDYSELISHLSAEKSAAAFASASQISDIEKS